MRELGTCLVTGATGFVGSHLVRALIDRGETVKALVRDPDTDKAKQLAAAGATLVTGDITRWDTLKDAVESVSTVFHSAAVLGPAGLDPAIYDRINGQGVGQVINACRDAGTVGRFICVSTVGVLGPLPPKTRACEGTPPKPVDIYETSKLRGEEIALAEAANGFPAVVVRPGWVYGPGDTRTLKLFRMIAKRRFMMIGPADNKQHPIYIDDLIDGIIVSASTEGVGGRVYHLCGPEVMTVNDLCTRVAEAVGVKLFPFRPPVWAVRWPAWCVGKLFSLWGGDPPIDHRKADFFIVNRAYSIKRAKEELGWKPAIKFEDGIKKTINWYREHGKI